MSKWKKRLAALLAAVMLISTLPASAFAAGEPPNYDEEVMPTSLLPLKEYDLSKYVYGHGYATATVSDLYREEVKRVPFETFVNAIEDAITKANEWKDVGEETIPSIQNAQSIAWAVYNDDKRFTIVKKGGTTDLSVLPSYTDSTLELIVSEKDDVDPADEDNLRYLVRAVASTKSVDDLLAFSVYDKEGEKIEPYNPYRFGLSSFQVSNADWNRVLEGVYLSVDWQEENSDNLDVKLYTDYGSDEEQEVADQILQRTGTDGYLYNGEDGRFLLPLTAVFYRYGEIADTLNFQVYIYAVYGSIRIPEFLEGKDSSAEGDIYSNWSRSWGKGPQITFYLKPAYETTDQYYVKLTYDHPEMSHGQTWEDFVTAAVVGEYSNEQVDEIEAEIAETTEANIKDQLFSDTGYLADFSEGDVVITVLDKYGRTYCATYELEEDSIGSLRIDNLYTESGRRLYDDYDYDIEESEEEYIYTLTYVATWEVGNRASDKYALRLRFTSSYVDMSHIAKAVEGWPYDEEGERLTDDETVKEWVNEESRADIKQDLFAGTTGSTSDKDGYLANYSEGAEFTILDARDGIHYIKLTIKDTPEPEMRINPSFYTESGDRVDGSSSRSEEEYIYTLPYVRPEEDGNRASDNYALSLEFYLNLYPYDYGDMSYIAKAVEGWPYDEEGERLTDDETVKAWMNEGSRVDIKQDLFAGTMGSTSDTYGYLANYSEGVEFTILDTRGGIHYIKFTIRDGPGNIDSLGIARLYTESGKFLSSFYDYGKEEYTYTLPYVASEEDGNKAHDKYALSLGFRPSYGDMDYIAKAVEGWPYDKEGKRLTDDEAVQKWVNDESRRDIKQDLFAGIDGNDADTKGYLTDYSEGVAFTILDASGAHHYIKFTIKDGTKPVPVPSAPAYEPSNDTYFQVVGASAKSLDDYTFESQEDIQIYYDEQFKAWSIPSNVDSYYMGAIRSGKNYGFQTIFILDSDGVSPVTSEMIYPEFSTRSVTNMYASTDYRSADRQISRITGKNFVSGKPIAYSAAAEDGKTLKNYWVTFLTPQEGVELFVNAANVETFKEDDGKGSKLPTREVYLVGENGYHDIFIANVGKDEMKGLTATLSPEAAKVVALDEYWTVNNSTLSGFTTVEIDTENSPNGYLPNITKIRLVRAKDPETGEPVTDEIKGTLTISYDGGDPVTILLKGVATDEKIATQTLNFGVQYVAYEQMIQTGILGGKNNSDKNNGNNFGVTFSYTGNLPQGITLDPNTGILYGVPQKSGEFKIKVTANFGDRNEDGEDETDSKEYTLKIESNLDRNVWWYERDIWNTGGTDDIYADLYKVTLAIPNEDGTVSSAGEDVSTGENSWDNDTMDFWSDGPIDHFDQSERVVEGEGESEGEDGAEGETGPVTVANVWLDGQHLTLNKDYTAEEGSTKITIKTQTLTNVTNGTHTISAEFRDGSGNLHSANQNYKLTTKGTKVSSGGGGSAGNLPAPAPEPEPEPDKPATPDPATGLPFVDASMDDWFLSYVQDVYKRGLMKGTSGTTFSPKATTSRGMIATILYRLAGEPAIEGGSNFADIPQGMWYTQAAAWAVENGIINGYGNNLFGPDDDVSREQLVMILMRYAAMVQFDISVRADLTKYSDSGEIYAEFTDAISWAVAEGLLIGNNNGALNPKGTATRAEVATILSRFCTLMESKA